MDSEHRHELKSNELVDFLTHFPEFLKKNANMIIGITLIVVGIISWPLLSNMSEQKAIAEQSQVAQSIQLLGRNIGKAFEAYSGNPEQLNPALDTILANADELINLTDQTDNPDLMALAYIKAGQAFRMELHLKKEVVSAELIDTQTQKAQQAYEKAENIAVLPTMKAMAKFGLGLCAEERGQTQQAADLYTEIVNDEIFAVTIFPKQAQLRLDAIEDNAESFTFVQAPEPVIEEAITFPAETETIMDVQDAGIEKTELPKTTDTKPAAENAEN